MSWFTLHNENNKSKASISFYSSSLISLAILGVSFAVNLFSSLFVAVLLLVITLYIETVRKESNGRLIKNGVFGGFWLSIPVYVYLANYT